MGVEGGTSWILRHSGSGRWYLHDANVFLQYSSRSRVELIDTIPTYLPRYLPMLVFIHPSIVFVLSSRLVGRYLSFSCILDYHHLGTYKVSIMERVYTVSLAKFSFKLHEPSNPSVA